MNTLKERFYKLSTFRQDFIIEEYEIEEVKELELYQALKDIIRYEIEQKIEEIKEVITLDRDIEIVSKIDNLLLELN